MKTFNEIYYIENTPWKRKLNLDELKRFNDIKYGDKIFLHIDYFKTIFITKAENRNINTFIPLLNICLRIREVIKKLYPYNEVYVLIYMKDLKLLNILNYSTLKFIVDIIPNFALINENDKEILDSLKNFNSNSYKHIFYKINNKISNYFDKDNCQNWYIYQGKIIIRS